MILVLGGTAESRDITISLVNNGYQVLYSSTTGIINDLPSSVKYFTGTLNQESFGRLLVSNKVQCVVDATHPFAIQISSLAINITAQLTVPYVRLERQSLTHNNDSEFVKYVDTIDSAVRLVQAIPGRIFSTLGSRMLPQLFEKLTERKQDIAVRVLPVTDSIAQCEKLDIHQSMICAMQGPFSRELNVVCIRHFQTASMLSKDSGDKGGLQEKIDACNETGCTLVVINRPPIEYPCICYSVEKCLNLISKISVKLFS